MASGMVRRKQSTTISPKQLKHFAVAAVVLTALLALFASNEDWGAQAQLEAVEAKNRLAAAEAKKLGTTRLEAKLKVRRDTSRGMAMSDPSDSSGSDGGGGGGGGGYIEPPVAAGGAIGTAGGMPQPPGKKKKKASRPELSEEQRQQIEAASRARSGAPEQDGD